MRNSRVLAHGAPKSILRSTRYHLHLLPHRSRRLYLGGCRKLVGQLVHRTLRTRPGNWQQVNHSASVRSRVLASPDPGRIGHDVASLDSFWYHAW